MKLKTLVTFLAALCVAPQAFADAAEEDNLCTVAGAAEFLASTDAQPENVFAMNTADAVLSDAELGEYRGARFDPISIINAAQLARSEGNSIGDGVSSGNIHIDQGAFGNSDVTGNIVVNTGHNNVIQADTTVQINYYGSVAP